MEKKNIQRSNPKRTRDNILVAIALGIVFFGVDFITIDVIKANHDITNSSNDLIINMNDNLDNTVNTPNEITDGDRGVNFENFER